MRISWERLEGFQKKLKLCLDVGENKFTHQWRKPLRNILQYVLRSV